MIIRSSDYWDGVERTRIFANAIRAAGICERRCVPCCLLLLLRFYWRSSDQVGLVDDGAGLPGADADEDAFVEPVECGRGGLDLGRGAEGVLARVDVLAAGESGEHVGAAVAHAA